MLFKLFMLFFLTPLIELALLLKVSQYVGVFNTVMIVVITALLGAALAKSQGLSILFKIRREVMEGRPPGNSLLDGVLILAGGIVLLTPGLLTDALGFLLLIPVTRQFIREQVKKQLQRQIDRKRFRWRG